MKVKDLIEKLSKLDKDAYVVGNLASMEFGPYLLDICEEINRDSLKMVFIGAEEGKELNNEQKEFYEKLKKSK